MIIFNQTNDMGLTYATIELANAEDILLERRSIIDKDDIRRMSVSMLADTGSYMMAINENIQEFFQLPVIGKKPALLANGERIYCDVVSPIEVRFGNRKIIASALVLPGDAEPLLGAIPMEEMDVLIDPLRQQLVVNPAHPDYAELRL